MFLPELLYQIKAHLLNLFWIRVIDWVMILGEYFGYNDRGRTAYKERIFSDIGVDFNIKEKSDLSKITDLIWLNTS